MEIKNTVPPKVKKVTTIYVVYQNNNLSGLKVSLRLNFYLSVHWRLLNGTNNLTP